MSTSAYARFLNSIENVPTDVLAEWCVPASNDRRVANFPLVKTWRGWKPVEGTAEFPMILVSWFGANAYSLWVNGHDWRRYREDRVSFLPTEAQWECAAQEAAKPDCADAWVERHQIGQTYGPVLLAAPVNQRRAVSKFGVQHMAGNVWQWCQDWFSPTFYQSRAELSVDSWNSQRTGLRSERGGSWVGPAYLARRTYRRGRPPYAKGRCLGFRCVGKL